MDLQLVGVVAGLIITALGMWKEEGLVALCGVFIVGACLGVCGNVL